MTTSENYVVLKTRRPTVTAGGTTVTTYSYFSAADILRRNLDRDADTDH